MLRHGSLREKRLCASDPKRGDLVVEGASRRGAEMRFKRPPRDMQVRNDVRDVELPSEVRLHQHKASAHKLIPYRVAIG